MLLVLDGLCSARGTRKCRCGCPGALTVREEMGRHSSRGDTVLSWGLVGVRVWKLLLETLSLGVSSLLSVKPVLSSLSVMESQGEKSCP